jgi:polyhydroxybutyrate depolymerase
MRLNQYAGVIVLTFLSFLTVAAEAAGVRALEWKIDGTTRRALVHFPATTNGAPIIFAFHGHGGTMNFAARRFRLHELWPEAVVVYPQGLPTRTAHDLEGKLPGWLMLPSRDNRDLKLFDAMLATARRDWQIDTNRVYVTGQSNGGGFAYLLWGTRGELLAAVAPVAAPGGQFLRHAKPCPDLHIAGRNDAVVDFKLQERTVEAARRINSTNAPVEFVVHDGGHLYPEEAPGKIVAFFKQHTRAGKE